MSSLNEHDIIKRQSILRHNKLSVDDNSVESSFTVYPRENLAPENELRSSLAKKETNAVLFLKCCVIGVLILAAFAISVMTFLLISQTEYNLFVSSFTNDANRLTLAHYDVTIQRGLVSASFIIRYLMQAAVQSQDPVDTKLIDFNIFGHNMLRLGKAESIAFVPFIQRVNQSEWEDTNTRNLFWTAFKNDKGNSNSSKATIWDFSASLVVNDTQLAPISQITPLEYRRNMLLLNSYSENVRRQAIEILLKDSRPVSSGILNNETESTFVTNYTYTPRTILMVPAISVIGNNETIGMTFLEHTWDAGFRGILQGFSSVHAVVSNTCGDQFTLTINGSEATYLGEGDLHDSRYNLFVVSTSETEQLHYWENIQSRVTESHYSFTERSQDWMAREPMENECRYEVRFFPTDDYHKLYSTGRAIRYALGVSFLFLFTILCFIAYDSLVEKRQSIVMNTAVVSSDIVNQLYPPSFIRRFTQSQSVASTERKTIQPPDSTRVTKSDGQNVTHGPKELSSLKDILLRGSLSDSIQRPSKIFAEMFTDVSVIFADISGFTAWSSEREPVQVFQLLEALYSAFDEVAKDLGVFKVETIGDCYVAVVGLPAPRPAHAVVSCRFAHEIHKCIHRLTKELEVQLGPGTSDLQLRIGIHSGPVTAGVLRGEKSRFQLFGDTMNTAARMESTGKRGMTHVSEDTAKLLAKFGKQYWVTSRDEVVYAKGKGELQTYWVHTKHRRNKSSQSNALSSKNATKLDDFLQAQESNASKNDEDWALLSVEDSCMEDKEGTQKERLIEWNTEILFKMLCRLEWNRRSVPISETFALHPDQVDDVNTNNESASNSQNSDSTSYSRVLMEIMGKHDISGVNMLTYDENTVEDLSDNSCILSDGIRKELKQFVTDIAEYYNPLPFHNFEHASHVVLSSLKLLNCVVTGSLSSSAEHHFTTFGIASDPLTHFVVVLAAIVHDAGHPGMTNAELIDTNHKLYQMYSQKSIAEWHSIYLTLTTLDKYKLLQRGIYKTEEECNRFRDLLCHSVLATDIIGNKLDSLWTLAFDSTAESEHDVSSLLNRRASVALQLIIQASDVAHTMQHWHVYTKWNEKLFVERYLAYKSGSSSVDPSLRWYEGELSFLDNYVIPLAKRLRECKIYGASSEEYHGFAIENRREWERKGRDIVSVMQLRASIGISN